MPSLDSDVFAPYADQGLVAFAISSSTIGTETPERLADFVHAMGLTMTVLADYDVTIYNDYRITSNDSFAPYPREFVIGRDGRILYTSPHIDVAELRAAIEEGLNNGSSP